jgi:hypothetical protein
MAFPTPPDVDIPRWCYAGGVYIEPSLERRRVGWKEQTSGYATIPAYQEENWINYSAGEWINYLAAYALPYVAAGKFDAGLELYNNQPAKFYNAANDKYTSIKSSPSQSAASVPLVLPPALPATPLPMVSDASGTMSFSTISSSAVAGITNGSAPINGQVGEYFVYNGSKSVNQSSGIVDILSINFNPGVWKFSAVASMILSPPASFFNQAGLSIFFNNTNTTPFPVLYNYNTASVFGVYENFQVVLNNYIITSSVVFPLYFLGSFGTYETVTTSIFYSFLAQRIA